MGPAFGPIEAGAGKIPALLPEIFRVDTMIDTPAASFYREFELIFSPGQELLFDEAFGQLHSYPAREMIVAGSAEADGRVFFLCGFARLLRHQGGECFDGIGNFRAGEGVVAMAALGFDGQEVGFDQLCEVHAAIGGGGVHGCGEFGSRIGAAVEQRPENVGADGVADQLGDILKHGLKYC